MLAHVRKRPQAQRELSGNPARPTVPTRTSENEANATPASAAVSGLGHDFSRIPVYPTVLRRKAMLGSVTEFERQADVMAGQTTRIGEPPAIQRRCTECEDEEEQMLQPKSTAPAGDGAALNVGAAERAAKGGGASLPGEVRSYFEPRFGYDFSAVRVHAGSEGAEAARGIQARAYTIGPDIVFGSGEYAPATVEGKRLLAHELTHVVQQDGGRAAFPAIQRDPVPKPAPKKKASKKTAPAFKPRRMKLDDVVKEMTGLGGPYTDAKAWAATMKKGKFLGHEIDNGVRPEFQKMLDAGAKKVDEEYKKSGNPIPKDYGIRYIGGFRNEVSPHGAGVAIDIDGGDNPYISHQRDNPVTAELEPVYHRIAEFILNDPIDGEQSIIPKLITTGQSLPKGGKPSRRERVGQYYDRLAKESGAMRRYFELMNDDAQLKAFLAGDWTKTHGGATPPAPDDMKKQMWEDYALLGGAIPKGGPPGISGFKKPPEENRPFHPWNQPQKDPAAGFLTIPREVVLGLGQAVPRWGAIDFGPESGDVMHFDDRYGVGQPFEDAKAPAQAKVDAENATAKEAADKKAAEEKKAEEENAAAEEKSAGSGSAAPPPQRKATIGSPDDAYERQADEVADRVIRMDGPEPGAASALAAGHRDAPLPAETRAYFEPRLGHDFSAVRVFADHEAAEAARGIGARAYTVGNDIVFGRGEYAPATPDGRRLLAHELTHVGQQRNGAAPDVVRRSIRPADVSQELVGQQYSLRKAFQEGAIDLPAGSLVTVVSWSDSDSTAEVSAASVAGTFKVPKHLLVPSQAKTSGIAPYGVGLEKFEKQAEKGAADLEAFKKTESTYKTAKGKAFFAKEVSDRETEQKRVETALDVRLIQATMLNRFDPIIKKWVDFYNTQFGFTGAQGLDPNLIKAMVYKESQMGTFGDFMSDPPTMVILNRFNILQAIDSWPEEQLPVIHEAMPALIAKYHLQDIETELLKAETEFDTLKKKVNAGTAKPDEVSRFNELDAKRQPKDSWQVWFLEFRAPGETKGFKEAAEEFLNATDSPGGKAHKDDYDFWIRVGIRAVFEKHKQVSSWAEAARAYNGKGKDARAYRDTVVQRAEQAVRAEKAGKEFVPGNL